MIKSVLFFLFVVVTAWAETDSLAHRYVVENNIASLQMYIANGGDVNYEIKKRSPLLLAVILERHKIARLLLDAGAKIEYKDVNILTQALQREDLTMAELLVKQGANIDAKGFFSNNSLLYDLLLARKYQSVKWLLEHKAHFRTKGGLTPFALAVCYAPVDVIESFLASSADVNMHDDTLGPLLAIAISLNRDEVARRLVEKEIDPKTDLVRLAIKNKNLLLLKTLLDKKRSQWDLSVLWSEALQSDDTMILQTLLDTNMPLNTYKGDHSLIYYAMKDKKWESLEWLLEHSPFLPNESEALFYAIRQGDIKNVQTLLDKNVDSKRLNAKGYSALLWAMKYKQFEIASLLIDHDTDLEALDAKDESVLFKAITYQQNEIVKRLLDKNVTTTTANDQGYTPFYQAIRVSNFFAFSHLLASQEISSSIDEEEKSPIALSVQRGLDRFFYALFSKAYIGVKDHEGNTLMHKAAFYNRNTMLELLLLNSANKEAVNDRGETPLIVAAKEGSFECVTLLTYFQANRDSVDKRGFTAYNWAEKNNHLEVAKWLKDYAIQQKIQERKRLEALIQSQENNTSDEITNPFQQPL